MLLKMRDAAKQTEEKLKESDEALLEKEWTVYDITKALFAAIVQSLQTALIKTQLPALLCAQLIASSVAPVFGLQVLARLLRECPGCLGKRELPFPVYHALSNTQVSQGRLLWACVWGGHKSVSGLDWLLPSWALRHVSIHSRSIYCAV